jgi:hypothetical protein
MAVAVALGCSLSQKDRSDDAAPSRAASRAPQAPAAAPALDRGGRAKAVLEKWNDALSKHDTAPLRDLYAESVQYYGRASSRDTVLEDKARALGQARDYSQTVTNVQVDDRGKEIRLRFEKSWVGGGRPGRATGLLTVAEAGGPLRITSESDETTDKRMQAAAAPSNCENAVESLVAATAPAKAMLSGPVDPAAGHRSNGTRIEDGPPSDSVYTVAVHESHDTHLATLGRFTVDPKTGVVKETMPVEATLKTDPGLVAKLQAVCR